MRRGINHIDATERRELERIVEIILEEFDDVHALAQRQWKADASITQIILYGSRARGEGVDEHHTRVGKHSDWDIMVVVDDERLTDRRHWKNVTERLQRENQITHWLRSPAHYFVYTIDQINASLASGRYFFLDFLRDGIVVYETELPEFIKPKPLPLRRVGEMSKEYFEDWFKSAIEFFDDFETNVEKGRLKKAAFELHQSVERLYHTVLLVYTLYSPHSHNIVVLRHAAEMHDPLLYPAWPRERPEEVDLFEKLQQAYVKARYPRDYHITEEQLAWLGERTRALIPLVEASCKGHLEKLRTVTSG